MLHQLIALNYLTGHHWKLLAAKGRISFFLMAEQTINKMKTQPMEWEKIFTHYTTDRLTKSLQGLQRASETQGQQSKEPCEEMEKGNSYLKKTHIEMANRLVDI